MGGAATVLAEEPPGRPSPPFPSVSQLHPVSRAPLMFQGLGQSEGSPRLVTHSICNEEGVGLSKQLSLKGQNEM